MNRMKHLGLALIGGCVAGLNFGCAILGSMIAVGHFFVATGREVKPISDIPETSEEKEESSDAE